MGAATALQVDDGAAGTSAIVALGSLFKLTEVYLWDDGSTETQESRSVTKSNKSPHYDKDPGAENSTTSEFCGSAEDMELIEQMNALGLPVSFQTNKKNISRKSAKKKSSSMMDTSGSTEIENEAPKIRRVSEGEIVSLPPFHDDSIPSNSLFSVSMVGRSVSSCYDVAADTEKFMCYAAEGESVSSTGADHCVINEPSSAEVTSLHSSIQDHLSMEDGVMSKRELHTYTELDGVGVVNLPVFHPNEACADYTQEESPGSFNEHKNLNLDHDEEIQTCRLADPILLEEATENSIPKVLQSDKMKSSICSGEYGEWRIYWDSFYQRDYYYSVKTKESTWFPPPGMEHRTFFGGTDNLNESVGKSDEVLTKISETGISYTSASGDDKVEDCSNDSRLPDELVIYQDSSCYEETMTYLANNQDINGLTDASAEVVSEETLQSDELDVQCYSHVRRKERMRKKRVNRTSYIADEDLKFPLLEEYSTTIEKYWYQRYLLFSRFDDGVKLDEEGWFSVTPELIAKHHALRCGSNTIIDGFTGVGGNAIQFAKRAKHVIAVDIDPRKIEYANHNAVIYGVDDRIDFVRGDYFFLAPKLKADTVFLSPPWGGPNYRKVKTYDIKTMLKPHDGFFLFEVAKRIASEVVFFLPKNVDMNQLAELSLSSSPPWSLEVERNFLNGRLKAITAYFTSPEISEQ